MVNIINFLQIEWREILTTIIGGTIGGLITYLYVIRTENKREARGIHREVERDLQAKKEKCTKSLLNTQMAISIQLDSARSVKEIVNNILNFNILGSTLEQRLKNILSTSERISTLEDLIKKENYKITNLLNLTDYQLVQRADSNIISLPYEIFEIPTLLTKNNVVVSDLACYFKTLADCNRKYTEITTEAKRNNEIKNIIVSQLVAKGEMGLSQYLSDDTLSTYLLIIASMFTISFNLREMLNNYLDKAENAFSKSSHYIEIIGISEPIR